jgi:hypothetical protein
MRYGTADRDLNALYDLRTVKDIVVWKRLSDSDAWFVTTNAEYGLCTIEREGYFTDESKDPLTFDTIVAGGESYQPTLIDHRGLAGSPGA